MRDMRHAVMACRYQKCLDKFGGHQYCQATGAFQHWVKMIAHDYKKSLICDEI